MSKIGKKPIDIPEKVEVEINQKYIKVTGPKGSLEKPLPEGIFVEKSDNRLKVLLEGDDKKTKSLYGTMRSIISSMIKGVSEGWSKKVELVGTGYKAELSGNNLILSVGYSHPVIIKATQGISFKVEKNEISIEGVDKELVGQIAANIRSVRPPEPYKGKGIRYKDEIIRRKPGKAAKTVGVS